MENTMDDLTKRIGDNFGEIRDELSERTQEIREAITTFVDEHPIQAVGMAFGIGYLLSGALFSRTTFRAAAFGGRMVIGGFLKQLVAGIGPGMVIAAFTGGRGGERGEHHEPEERPGSSGGDGNPSQR